MLRVVFTDQLVMIQKALFSCPATHFDSSLISIYSECSSRTILGEITLSWRTVSFITHFLWEKTILNLSFHQVNFTGEMQLHWLFTFLSLYEEYLLRGTTCFSLIFWLEKKHIPDTLQTLVSGRYLVQKNIGSTDFSIFIAVWQETAAHAYNLTL